VNVKRQLSYSLLSRLLLYLLLVAQLGIHVDMMFSDNPFQEREGMEMCTEDGESEEESKEEEKMNEVVPIHFFDGMSEMIMISQQQFQHVLLAHLGEVITPPPEYVNC
jgi:hypothetical protein